MNGNDTTRQPETLDEFFGSKNDKNVRKTSAKHVFGACTHTLMNGGVAKVVDDTLFHYLYAKSVLAGRDLYYCELRSWEWFKMFLDIDMKMEYELKSDEDTENIRLSDEFIDKLASCIHMAVKKFFPVVDESLANPFSYMICDTPASFVREDDVKKVSVYKFGLHVIMHNITVSTHEALLMREMIVEELSVNGPEAKDVDWAEAVDNAPLCNQGPGAGGLRMVGSQKCVKINRNSDNVVSDNCMGNYKTIRRAYGFRAYYVNGILDQVQSDVFQKNFYKVVSFASIREKLSHNDPNGPKQNLLTIGWTRPIGCPSYGNLKEIKGMQKTKTKQRVFDDDKNGMKTWTTKVNVTNPKIIEILERNIRTRFLHGNWSETRVKTVVTNAEQTMYWISVTGKGSNFCMNKIPPFCDHNTSSVWFIMDKMGLSQKCFCKKLTTEDRRGRMCKDFRSMPPKKLESWEIAILFPTTTSEQQKKFEPQSGVKRATSIFGSNFTESLNQGNKKGKK